MDWRSPCSQDGTHPAGGEYVVHHERPYPHRLDRAFRIGAIVVAVAVTVLVAGWLYTANGPATGSWAGPAAVVLGLVPAALAYGPTRAVGIVGGLRRKAYVVDWQDGPPDR